MQLVNLKMNFMLHNPILKEFKAKATFFAATSYDDQIMWGSKKKNNWSKENTKYHTIPFSFMGKKERLILRDEDMEVGSHTCNHPNLDELSIPPIPIDGHILFLTAKGKLLAYE